MYKYKLAIFDLDGTLLDTLEDLYLSANHALTENGLPQHSKDDVRRFVGNGIAKLIERAVPQGSGAETISRVFDSFNAYYAQHCADHTQPYPGVLELLRALQTAGIRTAVVSNKADYAVQSLCETYFPGLLDACAGEREGVRRKPSPDAVNAVLAALSMEHTDAVYIGDSDVDIETAKNASMPCISVDWGFRDTAFLIDHGASLILSTAKELEGWLLEET